PLGKFDGKADKGFLVEYSVNSKAFRVFNSRTRIVQETLHINFLENKPNVVRIGPKWLFDTDTLTQSMNYQPVVAGNQPNDYASIKENLVADKVGKETVYAQQYVLRPLWSTGLQDPYNTDADAAFDVKENENEVYVSPSESAKTANKKHDDTAKRNDKGKSPVDSPIGVRDLRAEFEEFSSNCTNRVNAISAPVTVAGPNPTNSTNSFNITSPYDTAVSANFRIARKSLFVDPSKYLDDLDMTELEDIVYLDIEEDVGVEADLSNLDWKQIYLSMTRMVKEQSRLHQINDEDFHTYMFACFLSQEEPKKVHQALKDPSWIEAMQEELLLFKMQKVWELVDLPKGKRAIGSKWDFRNKKDERRIVIRNKARLTLFIKKQKGDIFLVQVYVNDIIFGSTNKELCKAFEKLMKDKFQMSSMEEITFFLRLQVKKKDDGIFISQDKYVAKILRKFGFIDVKSTSTLLKQRSLYSRIIMSVVATLSTEAEFVAVVSYC
nr:hypothetical protein [Tanacetum cinerariifolium]